MSISKNVGAFSKYLSKVRSRPSYFKTKDTVESFFNKVPLIGKPINHGLTSAKSAVKTLLYGSNWFEDLGFYYLGPVDGHDLETLCDVLKRAKDIHRPVFLHIETQKGKGYQYAEENPGEYHGTSGFDIDTGKTVQGGGTNFSNEFGLYLTELGRKDQRICAITAAMKYGTGLNHFYKEFKREGRFFDVGIAEPHAVTFAGGLAANGMLPVFAVYSSFLQRCYDEILHDLSIEKQHVLIGVDRAGIVGNDGETHQGLFDVSMLCSIPGIVIYSPATYDEMRWAVDQSLYHQDGVCCVRYPRGGEFPLDQERFPPNQEFVFSGGQSKNIILTYGRICGEVCKAEKILQKQGIDVSVLKLNQILPLPQKAAELVQRAGKVLFVEEGIKAGGIGQLLGSMLQENGAKTAYQILAIEGFVPQASVADAIKKAGMDGEGIAKRFLSMG